MYIEVEIVDNSLFIILSTYYIASHILRREFQKCLIQNHERRYLKGYWCDMIYPLHPMEYFTSPKAISTQLKKFQ